VAPSTTLGAGHGHLGLEQVGDAPVGLPWSVDRRNRSLACQGGQEEESGRRPDHEPHLRVARPRRPPALARRRWVHRTLRQRHPYCRLPRCQQRQDAANIPGEYRRDVSVPAHVCGPWVLGQASAEVVTGHGAILAHPADTSQLSSGPLSFCRVTAW